MIVWVVALRAEAAPLIAGRGFDTVGGRTPWPLYAGGGEALVIAGVGRNSAAAACGWAQGHLRPPAHSAWLNVGIAGHSSGPVGHAFVAHRVREAATGRAWYPPPLPGHELGGETLTTVDQPETAFDRPGAYDMEASGFLAATARWATAELAQVVKVISDTPAQPAAQLDRRQVGSLIEARLPELESVARALATSSEILAGRAADPPGYEALVGRWHFTVTQQRQLRRLLERRAALTRTQFDPDSMAQAADRTTTQTTAKAVLRSLAEQVEQLGVEA